MGSALYNLGHVQYRQQKGRGGAEEKWPGRRNGRAKQSIAVGADKYLIGMYYELVITLHNGPRCNTIDRGKIYLPSPLPRMEQRESAVSRGHSRITLRGNRVRHSRVRNSRKSNLHAIERARNPLKGEVYRGNFSPMEKSSRDFLHFLFIELYSTIPIYIYIYT